MITLNFPEKEIRTFEELENLLQEQESDVTVVFSSGNYFGSLNLENLKCKSLTLFGNGQVNFTGSTKRQVDFTQYNNNILYTQIEKNLNFDRLKVEGQQYILSRFPNYNKNEPLCGSTKYETILSRSKSWNLKEKAYMHSLHDHEWGGNDYTIDNVQNGKLELNWVGNNNRGRDFKKDCVYVENIFEELDSPNEWYYDKDTGNLYIYKDENLPQTATIQTSDLLNLISVKNCTQTNITIEGINFCDTNRSTFKSDWVRYLRSDWAFNYSSAIELRNSKNITLNKCNFKNLGNTAIGIYDYCENIIINNCDFTDNLSNGISILGDKNSTYCTSSWENNNHITKFESPEFSGVKSNLYPRNININNCYFYNLGLEDKQSAGVNISLAHKVKIESSTFHHLPRAGINICENAFGGHVVVDCDLFDCVRETGDHGPFNSWGRDRFWSLQAFDTTGKYGKNKKQYALTDMIDKNIIRHNRIVGSRGFGIDLDDGSSNYLIENNLCINKGIKLREGFNRIVRNNILINSPLDLHATYKGNDDEIYNNVVCNKSPINIAILNKGFTTKLYNNYFVNSNSKAKKLKILKGQSNFFINHDINEILKLNYNFSNIEVITNDFGKPGKPTPTQINTENYDNVEYIKNKYGIFSSLNEYSRSITGAKSFNGLYVKKLNLFSPLKKIGVKNNDVIVSLNGVDIVGTEIDWKQINKKSEIGVIRQQELKILQ